MSAFSSASVGVALVALTESIRRDVRSTALALIYAVGAAALAAFAQPAVAALIEATGDAMAPAWYLMSLPLSASRRCPSCARPTRTGSRPGGHRDGLSL